MVASFGVLTSLLPWLVSILAFSLNLLSSYCQPTLAYPTGSPVNTTSSIPTPTPANTSTDFRDPCARLPLTPELWRNLNLDDYLLNFPGGKNLSLEAYAERVGATNFECGIGKLCVASQICMPIRGKDWYILVAAQNWNSFSNEMYQATAFALTIVQGLSTSIVNDIAPRERDHLMIQSTLLGVFAGLCGAIPGFLYPEGLAFFGAKVWPFVQGGTGFLSGIAWTYHNLYAHLPSDEFSKTMDVQYLLSKAQAETQQKIATDTTQITRKGISTNEGLYGVLKDGMFLNNHHSASELSEGEIQAAISSVARARLLAAIWKATNYFILRGDKPCNKDGPDGALSGDDVLSYCNSEGIMMNIVQSKKGKLVERFPYAHLISAKYNFTTEYFVTHSWDCQQKYGTYSYDPYRNSVLPADPEAECIVSLAVCDMTRKDIRKKAKKKGVLAACRQVGKVPAI